MDLDFIKRCIHCDAPTEPLTLQEEKELIRSYQNGNTDARKKLIESNIRFVVKMALQYRNQGLCLSDLIQEGNLGLIEALEKFNPEKNCRLITYASWWIRLYLQRAIEQKTRPVNLPINKLELLRKVRSYETSFEMSNGRKPYSEEIADGLKADINKIEKIGHQAPSFHTIHHQDSDHPGMETVLQDEKYVDPRDRIWLKEATNRLKTAMQVLNNKEREVLSYRYNFDNGGKRLSLRKVGKKMGMSAEGVRRIEEQAMSKLRRPNIKERMEALLAN